MSPRRALRTDQAPAAIGPYSQGIVDEETGLVFCAGQIGLDPARGELVPGGVESECRRALENVRAVLAAAGCDFSAVVRVTLYLADMADFAAVNAIYATYMTEPYPARATVQASGLPKGARLELEVTALRR